MHLTPSWNNPDPRLLTENLGNYFSRTSRDSGFPILIYWPTFYLELLRWVRGIFSFQRNDEAKRFPESYSQLPQMCPPYLWLRVVERYTLIRSCVPPQHNSPGNISDQFHWSCKFSAPTLPSFISANLFWTRHLWYNRQDNAHPCTP